ncbi:undecaprenyl-diphosphatase [Pullulanibacillus camelliae]|uniref:Undecaprenyl-diphosphatase n=1 Tax=Pullulanibacillus camelliae TaxID=1707096 RepID=A0A8J2VRX6_9BACL|nr:undecaprenyl-diphosphatase [Pullulanibacillus camelliae]GGE36772.1 undecaprenyl-diphosphatase [Pullulanibacillus camelliae]
MHFDLPIYHFFNNMANHSTIVDDIMIFFTKYSPELYAAFLVVSWFLIRKSHLKERQTLVTAVFAIVFALIINMVIAHIWFRHRPFTTLPAGSYHLLVSHDANASFPSDHAAMSWALASTIWFSQKRWLRWTITIIASIVTISRLYVGVHWPSDLLAGIIVGLIATFIASKCTFITEPLTKFGTKILPPLRRNRDLSIGK